VTVEGQLLVIVEQLMSQTVPTVIMEACQHLTMLIITKPAEEWEDLVAKAVIHCLLPHFTAVSNSQAQIHPENIAVWRPAITSLCAIASHGLAITAEELAKQGAFSASISAAQAQLLPDPKTVSEEAFNMATAITRGALLPTMRHGPAALILARSRDATAQPPLSALATLGSMALECCESSGTTEKAPAVALLLSVLPGAAQAMLQVRCEWHASSSPTESLAACARVGQ
jgi:hypothetical protein